MPEIATAQEPATRPAEIHAGVFVGPVDVGLSRRRLTRGAVIAVVALVVGLFVPDMIDDPYYMGVAVDGVVLGIMAIGIGFLAHSSGLLSLGHTAFYGSAAYGVAIATSHWGWGPGPAFAFAVVGGTALSIVIGALAIRITGFGFLMLTLAFSQALFGVSQLTSLRSVTGAFDGLAVQYGADQTFFGMSQSDLGQPSSFWPLVWVAVVLVAFVLWIVRRSRFGIVLEAIRENEERARFSGYNTYGPRLAAFAISGACASLAGALFALKANFVSPDVLGFVTASDSLIATLVGGFVVLLGPVIGAILYVYAQGRFGDGGNLQLYMGLALIIAVVFLPGGLTGFVVQQAKRLRALVAGRDGRS